MSQTPRHLEVIYCDDIRDEIGFKVSYMGIYSGELSVTAAPVLLTKLCIAVKAITDVSDPFQSLEVRVLRGEGEDEVELLTTGVIPSVSEIPNPTSSSTLLITPMAFVLSPFQIDGDTTIRVNARTERGELRGEALRIRVVSPNLAATANLTPGSTAN